MIEGIFIMFQDVGNVNPKKVKSSLMKHRKNLINLENKFPNWKVLVLPAYPPQKSELRAIKLTPKGVIILYINIGFQSTPVVDFIYDIKQQNSWLEELIQEKVYIPIQYQETDVCYINLEENNVEEIERT
jgi:hypothetical protein